MSSEPDLALKPLPVTPEEWAAAIDALCRAKVATEAALDAINKAQQISSGLMQKIVRAKGTA